MVSSASPSWRYSSSVRACTAIAREVAPGSGFPVDDRDFHALVRQPQGQHQAGRSRAGDGYADLVCGVLRLSILLRG